ncbi:uncharacterized protein LOC131932373 isoform X2 [Physella acuta]|uniref:uncharacterized protein LOC131932373 isoform X2 n=1 Tax=Physella acuta TaxID=109671 RepID=UPI0027DCD76B|nr:uncharacterized protein LOC131932373 isoform X2 [Physella acuta]
MAKDTTTNDMAKDTTTNDMAKDTTTNDMAKDATDDMSKATFTDDMAKDRTTNDMAKNTTNDMAKATFTNDMAKDTTTDDMAKGKTTNDMANNIISNDMAKATFSDDMAKKTFNDMAKNTTTDQMAIDMANTTASDTIRKSPSLNTLEVPVDSRRSSGSENELTITDYFTFYELSQQPTDEGGWPHTGESHDHSGQAAGHQGSQIGDTRATVSDSSKSLYMAASPIVAQSGQINVDNTESVATGQSLAEADQKQLDTITTESVATGQSLAEADQKQLDTITTETVATGQSLAEADQKKLDTITTESVATGQSLAEADQKQLDTITTETVATGQSLAEADQKKLDTITTETVATGQSLAEADQKKLDTITTETVATGQSLAEADQKKLDTITTETVATGQSLAEADQKKLDTITTKTVATGQSLAEADQKKLDTITTETVATGQSLAEADQKKLDTITTETTTGQSLAAANTKEHDPQTVPLQASISTTDSSLLIVESSTEENIQVIPALSVEGSTTTSTSDHPVLLDTVTQSHHVTSSAHVHQDQTLTAHVQQVNDTFEEGEQALKLEERFSEGSQDIVESKTSSLLVEQQEMDVTQSQISRVSERCHDDGVERAVQSLEEKGESSSEANDHLHTKDENNKKLLTDDNGTWSETNKQHAKTEGSPSCEARDGSSVDVSMVTETVPFLPISDIVDQVNKATPPTPHGLTELDESGLSSGSQYAGGRDQSGVLEGMRGDNEETGVTASDGTGVSPHDTTETGELLTQSQLSGTRHLQNSSAGSGPIGSHAAAEDDNTLCHNADEQGLFDLRQRELNTEDKQGEHPTQTALVETQGQPSLQHKPAGGEGVMTDEFSSNQEYQSVTERSGTSGESYHGNEISTRDGTSGGDLAPLVTSPRMEKSSVEKVTDRSLLCSTTSGEHELTETVSVMPCDPLLHENIQESKPDLVSELTRVGNTFTIPLHASQLFTSANGENITEITDSSSMLKASVKQVEYAQDKASEGISTTTTTTDMCHNAAQQSLSEDEKTPAKSRQVMFSTKSAPLTQSSSEAKPATQMSDGDPSDAELHRQANLIINSVLYNILCQEFKNMLPTGHTSLPVDALALNSLASLVPGVTQSKSATGHTSLPEGVLALNSLTSLVPGDTESKSATGPSQPSRTHQSSTDNGIYPQVLGGQDISGQNIPGNLVQTVGDSLMDLKKESESSLPYSQNDTEENDKSNANTEGKDENKADKVLQQTLGIGASDEHSPHMGELSSHVVSETVADVVTSDPMNLTYPVGTIPPQSAHSVVTEHQKNNFNVERNNTKTQLTTAQTGIQPSGLQAQRDIQTLGLQASKAQTVTQPPGSQASKAQTDAQPSGLQAQTDTQPSGLQAQTDTQPSGLQAQADTQPSGLQAQTDTQPSGLQAQTDTQPSGLQAQTDTQPSGLQAQTDTQPSGLQAQTDTQPSRLQAQTDTQPSGLQAQTDTQPSGLQAQTDTQPSGLQAQTDTQPSRLQAQTDTQPSGLQAQTDTQPSGLQAQTDTQPSGLQAQTDTQPSRLQAQTDTQPSGLQAHTSNPAQIRQRHTRRASNPEDLNAKLTALFKNKRQKLPWKIPRFVYPCGSQISPNISQQQSQHAEGYLDSRPVRKAVSLFDVSSEVLHPSELVLPTAQGENARQSLRRPERRELINILKLEVQAIFDNLSEDSQRKEPSSLTGAGKQEKDIDGIQDEKAGMLVIAERDARLDLAAAFAGEGTNPTQATAITTAGKKDETIPTSDDATVLQHQKVTANGQDSNIKTSADSSYNVEDRNIKTTSAESSLNGDADRNIKTTSAESSLNVDADRNIKTTVAESSLNVDADRNIKTTVAESSLNVDADRNIKTTVADSSINVDEDRNIKTTSVDKSLTSSTITAFSELSTGTTQGNIPLVSSHDQGSHYQPSVATTSEAVEETLPDDEHFKEITSDEEGRSFEDVEEVDSSEEGKLSTTIIPFASHTVIHRNVRITPSHADKTRSASPASAWRLKRAAFSTSDDTDSSRKSLRESLEEAAEEALSSARDSPERSENLRMVSILTGLGPAAAHDEDLQPSDGSFNYWYFGDPSLEPWEGKDVHSPKEHLSSKARSRPTQPIQESDKDLQNKNIDGEINKAPGHSVHKPFTKNLFGVYSINNPLAASSLDEPFEPENPVLDSLLYPIAGLQPPGSNFFGSVPTQSRGFDLHKPGHYDHPRITLTSDSLEESLILADSSDAERLSMEMALSVLDGEDDLVENVVSDRTDQLSCISGDLADVGRNIELSHTEGDTSGDLSDGRTKELSHAEGDTSGDLSDGRTKELSHTEGDTSGDLSDVGRTKELSHTEGDTSGDLSDVGRTKELSHTEGDTSGDLSDGRTKELSHTGGDTISDLSDGRTKELSHTEGDTRGDVSNAIEMNRRNELLHTEGERAKEQSHTGGDTSEEQSHTGGDTSEEQSHTGGDTSEEQSYTEGGATSQLPHFADERNTALSHSDVRIDGMSYGGSRGTVTELDHYKGETAKEFSHIEGDTTKEISLTGGDITKEISLTGGDITKEISLTGGDITKEISLTGGDTNEELSFAGGDTVKELSGGDTSKDLSLSVDDVSKALSPSRGDTTNELTDTKGHSSVETTATGGDKELSLPGGETVKEQSHSGGDTTSHSGGDTSHSGGDTTSQLSLSGGETSSQLSSPSGETTKGLSLTEKNSSNELTHTDSNVSHTPKGFTSPHPSALGVSTDFHSIQLRPAVGESSVDPAWTSRPSENAHLFSAAGANSWPHSAHTDHNTDLTTWPHATYTDPTTSGLSKGLTSTGQLDHDSLSRLTTDAENAPGSSKNYTSESGVKELGSARVIEPETVHKDEVNREGADNNETAIDKHSESKKSKIDDKSNSYIESDRKYDNHVSDESFMEDETKVTTPSENRNKQITGSNLEEANTNFDTESESQHGNSEEIKMPNVAGGHSVAVEGEIGSTAENVSGQSATGKETADTHSSNNAESKIVFGTEITNTTDINTNEEIEQKSEEAFKFQAQGEISGNNSITQEKDYASNLKTEPGNISEPVSSVATGSDGPLQLSQLNGIPTRDGTKLAGPCQETENSQSLKVTGEISLTEDQDGSDSQECGSEGQYRSLAHETSEKQHKKLAHEDGEKLHKNLASNDNAEEDKKFASEDGVEKIYRNLALEDGEEQYNRNIANEDEYGMNISSDNSALRRKHLEILELAEEILNRSNQCYDVDDDSVDPALIEEWDDKPQLSEWEFYHTGRGGELSYRKEETLAKFPDVIVPGNKVTAVVPSGPVVNMPSEQDINRPSECEVSSESISKTNQITDKTPSSGELSFRKEETLGEHRQLLQPMKNMEAGPLLSKPQAEETPGDERTDMAGFSTEKNNQLSPRYVEDVSQEFPGSKQIFGSQHEKDQDTHQIFGQQHDQDTHQIFGQQQDQDTHQIFGHHEDQDTNKTFVHQEDKDYPANNSNNNLSINNNHLNSSVENHFTKDSTTEDMAEMDQSETFSLELTTTEGEDYDFDSGDLTTRDRERSPLSRRRNIPDIDISNYQILNEIEKLKSEHSKMMGLLERNRKKKERMRQNLPSRSDGSPGYLLESDSSGGDSPVTVIPRNGSVGGSTGTSPIDLSSLAPPPHIVGRRDDQRMGERNTGFRPVTVKDGSANTELTKGAYHHERSHPQTRSVSTNTVNASGYVNGYSRASTVDSFSQTIPDFLQDVSTNTNSVTRSVDSFISSESTSSSTSTITSKNISKSSIEKNSNNIVMNSVGTQFGQKETKSFMEERVDGRSSDEYSSQFMTDRFYHDDSSSTMSRDSTLSPLTLQAIMDDDTDSAFSMSTLNTRHMVTTGVGVSVDNLDDFTQTELLDLSLLTVKDNGTSFSSEGDSHDMSRIQKELDRLHNERIEIIELLSLHYLPSSLTIELLEAKLNYCIGQTDALLSTLEEAWDKEDTSPRKSKTYIKVTKEYLEEYKSQMSRSMKDIESCLETHQRKQNGVRGRRKTRGSDITDIKRRSEIEAFKLERLREQCRYEREKLRSRNYSPLNYSLSSSFENLSSTGSQSTESSMPRLMTPTQRRQYLVKLRRDIVQGSQGERLDHRHRSVSPQYTLRCPDQPWTLRASSCSPTRSETSSISSVPSLSPFTYRSRNGSYVRHQDRYYSPSYERMTSALRNLSSDYRANVMSSYSSRGLNPDQLIKESNEIRRQNQIQIEQAQEMLRQLDQKRFQVRQLERRQMEGSPNRPQPNHLDTSLASLGTPDHGLNNRRHSSRSTPSTFTEYARDHLVRGQRQINSFVNHHHHTVPPPASTSSHRQARRLSRQEHQRSATSTPGDKPTSTTVASQTDNLSQTGANLADQLEPGAGQLSNRGGTTSGSDLPQGDGQSSQDLTRGTTAE